MNPKIFLSALAIVTLASCSSAYKTGQTPDDVYYSPEKPIEYRASTQREVQQYEDYQTSRDNQYLRYKVRNRYRWNQIDDFDYWYDTRYNYNGYYTGLYNPYGTGYYNFYNSWGNSYFFGNPYYPIIFYKNPKVYTGYTAKGNLTAFTSKYYNNNNSSSFKTGYYGNSTRKFNNTNNSSYNNNNNSRTINTTPSSSAGGRSGGYNSSGSSSGSSRPSRN